jgi:hypothetical protein
MRRVPGLTLLTASALACAFGRNRVPVPPVTADLSGTWQLCLAERAETPPTQCGLMTVWRGHPPVTDGLPYFRFRTEVPLNSVFHLGAAPLSPYGVIRRDSPERLRLVFGLGEAAIDEFGGGVHALLVGTGDSLHAERAEYCHEVCTRYGAVVLWRRPAP